MNNDKLINSISQNLISGVPLDFAGLMARIESDGGKSTAPQYKAKPAAAKRIFGVAAGVVLVLCISLAAAVMLGGPMVQSEAECAPEATFEPVFDDITADSELYEPESSQSVIADAAGAYEEQDEVSDSDVSESDISESDMGGEE